MSVKSHVVAITGGARGIGLATAKAFHAAGAKVSLGDVDFELAQQEAAALHGQAFALDVRDRASFSKFLQDTETALGPVDILINNAGIMPSGAFIDESDAATQAQIDINLNGVILGCKLAIPSMLQRGQGHIVNLASMAGVLPLPGLAVYCATKFAVLGLTQSLREEYRDSGLRFSSILPAKVSTELASGTQQAGRGVPTSSADDVAAAILAAVTQDLAEVTVPRYLSAAPALLNLAPHVFQRGFRRLFDDRRILEKLDHQARAPYEQRLAKLSKKAPKTRISKTESAA
ncbi:MAG: SDR family oxidoreductase [Oceanococcus sp.]